MSTIKETYERIIKGPRMSDLEFDCDFQLKLALELESYSKSLIKQGLIKSPYSQQLRIFTDIFKDRKMNPLVAKKLLDEHPDVIACLDVYGADGYLALCVDEECFAKITFLFSLMDTKNDRVRATMTEFYAEAYRNMTTVAKRYIDFYAPIPSDKKVVT